MLSPKESMEYYKSHPEIVEHLCKFVQSLIDQYGDVTTETTLLTTVVAGFYLKYGEDFTRMLFEEALSHVKKFAPREYYES